MISKDTTICVYSICKNESKFAERWYNSVKEADYVCVLDTGSTDDTVEKMRALGVDVHQEIIDPWRFDDARNASQKYLPDADVYIVVDIDEVLNEGWADAIRERWIPGVHTRGEYLSRNTYQGQPSTQNWMHSKEWGWIYPCHEAMVRKSNNLIWYYPNEVCNCKDVVMFTHLQDLTKSRGSYLNLLKIRIEEYPEDAETSLYLIREYLYRHQFQDGIDLCNEMIEHREEHEWSDEQWSAVYYYKGKNEQEMRKTDDAIASFNKSIDIDDSHREPYVELAIIYLDKEKPHIAVGYLEQCQETTVFKDGSTRTWFNQDNLWSWQLDDWLGVAYYWARDKANAIKYTTKALAVLPDDERLKRNLEFSEQLPD